jgi:hypothetical protein
MDNLTSARDLLEQVRINDPESYERIQKLTQEKIVAYRARGGHRDNAGRKRLLCPKITCSFSLPDEIIIVLENYSKERSISKSKALEELVRKGLLSLNQG